MKETSRQRLFYIFPVLYIISVYMAFISFFTESRISFIHYLAFTPFIFGILNIIMSARYCKPEYYNIMFNSCIIVKYCMVPFYCRRVSCGWQFNFRNIASNASYVYSWICTGSYFMYCRMAGTRFWITLYNFISSVIL